MVKALQTVRTRTSALESDYTIYQPFVVTGHRTLARNAYHLYAHHNLPNAHGYLEESSQVTSTKRLRVYLYEFSG